jgi:deoxyribonuclease-4
VLHPGSAKAGDVGEAIAAAGKVIREALDESSPARCTWRTPRAPAGTLGPVVRRARALAEAAGGGRGSGCAWTPVTCSPRATTSAPPRAWPTRWRSATARSAWTAWDPAPQRLAGRPGLQSRPPRPRRLRRARRGRLRRFLSEPRFDGLPCVLETPADTKSKDGFTAAELGVLRAAARARGGGAGLGSGAGREAEGEAVAERRSAPRGQRCDSPAQGAAAASR